MVPQSEFAITSETLMKSVNDLYRSNGCEIKITSKSAKAAGVSIAFRKGLSNNDIMLMGRWRCPDTAQHYRDVDPFTLARISLVMARTDPFISLDLPIPPANQTWNQMTQSEPIQTFQEESLPQAVSWNPPPQMKSVPINQEILLDPLVTMDLPVIDVPYLNLPVTRSSTFEVHSLQKPAVFRPPPVSVRKDVSTVVQARPVCPPVLIPRCLFCLNTFYFL